MLIPDSALEMLHRLSAGELIELNDHMDINKETGDQWVGSLSVFIL